MSNIRNALVLIPAMSLYRRLMPPTDMHRLRRIAIANTLFPPTTVKKAIEKLGFLQADPIRSPARAQDLILRHRVKGYQAGDLEKRYPKLEVDEDFLFVYGFLSRTHSQLLYPREKYTLSSLEKEVLEHVGNNGHVHPQDLETTFGSKRTRNAWGGFSKATKRALEKLHHYGYLRVAGRRKGVRLYQRAPDPNKAHSPETRFRTLAFLIACFCSPIDKKTLTRTLNCLKHIVSKPSRRKALMNEVLESNGFQQEVIDGIEYIWVKPKDPIVEPGAQVRFLAPFDPLVRDRDRFEHLWNWTYRLEAYIPAAKRERGYYALPLLWRDYVIGWANANVVNDRLNLQIGYIDKAPRSKTFKNALEKEASQLAAFLHLPEDQWEFVK